MIYLDDLSVRDLPVRRANCFTTVTHPNRLRKPNTSMARPMIGWPVNTKKNPIAKIIDPLSFEVCRGETKRAPGRADNHNQSSNQEVRQSIRDASCREKARGAVRVGESGKTAQAVSLPVRSKLIGAACLKPSKKGTQ